MHPRTRPAMGWVLGFEIPSFGSSVQDSGFQAWCLRSGFWVEVWVLGSVFLVFGGRGVLGLEVEGWGLGCMVLG